jgi:hypothetical protein
MRDWLFLLAPPALIFYFIAFPDQFYAFVFWARLDWMKSVKDSRCGLFK